MATVIKTLKDNATGDTILPRTRTSIEALESALLEMIMGGASA